MIRVLQVILALPAQLDILDLKVHKESRQTQGQPDPQVKPDLQGRPVPLVLPDPQVKPDLQGQPVPLGRLVLRAQRV